MFQTKGLVLIQRKYRVIKYLQHNTDVGFAESHTSTTNILKCSGKHFMIKGAKYPFKPSKQSSIATLNSHELIVLFLHSS